MSKEREEREKMVFGELGEQIVMREELASYIHLRWSFVKPRLNGRIAGLRPLSLGFRKPNRRRSYVEN